MGKCQHCKMLPCKIPNCWSSVIIDTIVSFSHWSSGPFNRWLNVNWWKWLQQFCCWVFADELFMNFYLASALLVSFFSLLNSNSNCTHKIDYNITRHDKHTTIHWRLNGMQRLTEWKLLYHFSLFCFFLLRLHRMRKVLKSAKKISIRLNSVFTRFGTK